MVKKSIFLIISAALLGGLVLSANENITKLSLTKGEGCSHTNIQHHLAKEPSENEHGWPEHWGCCDCGAALSIVNEISTSSQTTTRREILSPENKDRHEYIDFAFSTKATEIKKSSFVDDLINNIVTNDKVKMLDQSDWSTINSTAPNYKYPGEVKYYAIDGRDALYLSAHLNTEQNNLRRSVNNGYSEVRFALDKLKNVSSISFDYKYAAETTFDYNHEGREFAQFHNANSGQYESHASLNLINDNQWHSITVKTNTPSAGFDYFILKLQEFKGEIYISNMQYNTYKQDINLRTIHSSGATNHGNSNGTHYEGHQDNISKIGAYCLRSDFSSASIQYANIVYNYDNPVTYTEDTKYIIIKCYIKSDEKTAINWFRVMYASDYDTPADPNKGPVFDDFAGDHTNLPTNTWLYLYAPLEKFVTSSGKIMPFSLFQGGTVIGHASYIIESVQICSSIEPQVYENSLLFDKSTNEYFLEGDKNPIFDDATYCISQTNMMSNFDTLKASKDGSTTYSYAQTSDGMLYKIPTLTVTKVFKTTADLQIFTAAESSLGSSVSKVYYALGNDIKYEYKTVSDWNGGSSYSNSLFGTLDGRGHTIYGFNTPGTVAYEALTPLRLNGASVIKNLNFDGVTIKGAGSGVFGHLSYQSHIEDVTFDNVRMPSNHTANNKPGLFGTGGTNCEKNNYTNVKFNFASSGPKDTTQICTSVLGFGGGSKSTSTDNFVNCEINNVQSYLNFVYHNSYDFSDFPGLSLNKTETNGGRELVYEKSTGKYYFNELADRGIDNTWSVELDGTPVSEKVSGDFGIATLTSPSGEKAYSDYCVADKVCETVEQLYSAIKVQNYDNVINDYVMLIHDIDADGYNWTGNFFSWSGYAQKAFRGVFDGRNYVVSNVNLASSFFGVISHEGLAKNVFFKDIKASGEASIAHYGYIAKLFNIKTSYKAGSTFNNASLIFGMRAESSCSVIRCVFDASGFSLGSLVGWESTGITFTDTVIKCKSYKYASSSDSGLGSASATKGTIESFPGLTVIIA